MNKIITIICVIAVCLQCGCSKQPIVAKAEVRVTIDSPNAHIEDGPIHEQARLMASDHLGKVLKHLELPRKWNMSENDALKRMRKDLVFNPKKDGILIIGIKSVDPDLAVQILNNMLDERLATPTAETSINYVPQTQVDFTNAPVRFEIVHNAEKIDDTKTIHVQDETTALFSSEQYMIPFGTIRIDAALVSFLVVKILLLVAYLWFVIVGFRTRIIWGLLNLLLPVAALFFTIFHFQKAKKPAIVYVSGLVLLVLTLIWSGKC
jgi:hypothetical protein